jgi:hypothetical protein
MVLTAASGTHNRRLLKQTMIVLQLATQSLLQLLLLLLLVLLLLVLQRQKLLPLQDSWMLLWAI